MSSAFINNNKTKMCCDLLNKPHCFHTNVFQLAVLTNVTIASSHSAPPDDGDYTETCCSCFNVNFNIPFKKNLCISWCKNFDNCIQSLFLGNALHGHFKGRHEYKLARRFSTNSRQKRGNRCCVSTIDIPGITRQEWAALWATRFANIYTHLLHHDSSTQHRTKCFFVKS